jgi:hypothetical protein
MARGVFRTVLAIMFSLPLVAIAYSEASAKNVQPVRRHGHLAESSQSPKAVRRLYRIWLLDCGAYKKMWIREAISDAATAHRSETGAPAASWLSP